MPQAYSLKTFLLIWFGDELDLKKMPCTIHQVPRFNGLLPQAYSLKTFLLIWFGDELDLNKLPYIVTKCPDYTLTHI